MQTDRHADLDEAKTTQRARRRILLAEDDGDLRQALHRVLELEGYDVLAVSSGAEMVERLAAWLLHEIERPPADAIVTDVRMPGYNGLHVMEGLRASGWRQPIVVMTAFGDDGIRERVRRLGGAAYLDKPFDPAELEGVLAALLD